METKPLGEFDIYVNDGNYGNIYPEKDKFSNSGIPFISATDFKGKEFNYKGIKYIDKDLHFDLLTKGHLKINDVVIVVRGNGIGKVGFFKDKIGECNMNAQLAFIRTNPEDLNSEYLYYLFSSSEYLNLIRKYGSGSAQPQLPINRLKLVPVIDKDIRYQKQIVKILSDLDSKIEINNKINQELEAMAKTIYDYWFVQFDFPDANGKPYKSSGGKMVYNEELKREIPEGWKDGKAGEILQFNPTESLQRNIVASYIDMNALPTQGYMTSRVQKKSFNGGMKFRNDDVLVARITPCLENGKTCLVSQLENDEVGFGSTEYIVLRGKNIPIPAFTSLFARSEYFRKYAIMNMTGTSGRKRVDYKQLELIKIAVPPTILLERFDSIIYPFFKKIILNTNENQKLAELRDWLLPMLMNGQVTVGEGKEQLLDMAAEPSSPYEKDKASIDSLFDTINYDYEVATIVLLTRQILDRTYGQKYIHKMLSNIQLLESLPVFKDLAFQENGWGMYSPILKKTIENKKFIKSEIINDQISVINFDYKYIKEVSTWINKEENKEFASQVEQMLNIYQKSLINKDMDRIELLNTVLECMNILETDNFDAIYNKMKKWRMYEDGYNNKAEKFKPEETRLMIDLIMELK